MNDLAAIAKQHKINLGEVIDPVVLAVRLVDVGVQISRAAAMCNVSRTTLHAKIKTIGTKNHEK